MASHQGAGFAFDMNMDLSDVFGTKSSEGETSSNFFFGDEDIDTTASMMDPILFPQQSAFDIPLDFTLDNTSGSASVWNGTLTPQIQNSMNMFPPTPTQSFDSTYQSIGSTLGKRSLHLDADLPMAKRHETADYTTSSLFSPILPSSTTPSSWALDNQHTPASSVEGGISDEAADMCATWFNKYAILPSDRHIDSLSQLTGEPADAIRHWFGRLMKQGMGTSQGDSAYKSQTALQQPEQFWNNLDVPQLPLEESTQESINTPAVHQTVTVSPSASTNALRGGKKSRCTPTEDRSLLGRDPNKIYQCTRKCGKRYGRKCDWKRNEEEGYPCKSWVCSLCTSEGVENVKPCFRKYHFAQHFRNIHPGVDCDNHEETSVVCSETEFPRKCGFCRHRFASRQERIDHIADHFKKGKSMLDWNDSEDNQDSDNTEDDDDKPSDDGSDGSRPPYPPPDCDPCGGSDPNYFGGGSGFNDGGSGGPSQGGFFQFQLSQLSSQSRSPSSSAKQHIIPTSALTQTSQRTRCASEPLFERSIDQPSTAGQWYTRSSLDTAKGDNMDAPARDDVSGLVAQDCPGSVSVLQINRQQGVEVDRAAEINAAEPQSDWLDVLLSSRKRTTSSLPTTAPPVDTSHIQVIAGKSASNPEADETESTRIDNIVASPGAFLDVLGRERRIQSPGLSSQEPKAIASSEPDDAGKQLVRSPVLQTIATTSQSFLSVRFLGSGGFSTVDEVVHRETKLRLGRKTLNNRTPAAIRELWKEVNVLQKLRHPHVIRFLGAYSKGDKMSILLSPIADTTLALWLDRHKHNQPANFSQVVTKMFGCLASSVRYLHEQRPVIKHMDIKPQNILIVEGDGVDPHVVLCDFGISSSDAITEGRMQPLTRHYVAPEAFAGFTRKQAADIWSLGCVLAEMASVAFRQGSPSWDDLREEFGGRTSKYYWQDVPGLQQRLVTLLENAPTSTESTVVRTLQSMLNAQPDERPDAAALTMIFTPAPCCLSWPNDKAAYPGPQEELSSVEMIVLEDGFEHRKQSHQHGQVNAGSEEALPSAKTWIEQCSHSHSACSHATSSHAKALPTRLVDLRPDGQAGSSIRIVDSNTVAPGAAPIEYVALSYVWSSSDINLSTKRLQISGSHADIPLSALSEAMKAAITAAQRLEYRYIWTDALCILQDSDADKRHECASMASTFRNAALTLVLDSVDNNMPAFLQSLSKTSSSTIDPASSGFSWDTRAWALQERLLSHRFLHLGQEQMYWECNSLKASETFPHGLPSLVWEKAHTKPDNNVPARGRKLSKQHSMPDQLEANVNMGHDPDAAQANRSRTPAKSNSERGARRTSPRLLRDCQYIKREADEHVIPSSYREPHAKEASSTAPASCPVLHIPNGSIFVTGLGNVKSKIQGHEDTLPSSSLTPPPNEASVGSGRQRIAASGQADQHGHVKRGDGVGYWRRSRSRAGNGRNGNGSGGFGNEEEAKEV